MEVSWTPKQGQGKEEDAMGKTLTNDSGHKDSNTSCTPGTLHKSFMLAVTNFSWGNDTCFFKA